MKKKQQKVTQRNYPTLSLLRRFSMSHTFGNVLLFACAAAGIIWANIPQAATYFDILHLDVGLTYMHQEFSHSIIHWINDGLMAIFFFLIGLEIKREVLVGELSSSKKASLPFIAALGGVIVPAILFTSLNNNPETASGWAIPTATDIAFSLGILMLLGKRVPVALKIFLAAFAIVDDILAVVIISIFYSSSIIWGYLFIALAIVAIMFLLNRWELYNNILFLLLGIAVWLLFAQSGIHPTIAGVLVAFTIPTNKRINTRRYVKLMDSTLGGLSIRAENERFLSKEELHWLHRLKLMTENVIPPSQKLELTLHSPVTFIILPLFALGNSGVRIISEQGMDWNIINDFSWSIALSMVFGKIIGITMFSWLAIQLKIAKYPFHTTFKHLIGMGILGGFGFTMSLFINELSGSSTDIINSGKIGIIIGSLSAGLLGYIYLYIILPKGKKKTA